MHCIKGNSVSMGLASRLGSQTGKNMCLLWALLLPSQAESFLGALCFLARVFVEQLLPQVPSMLCSVSHLVRLISEHWWRQSRGKCTLKTGSQ